MLTSGPIEIYMAGAQQAHTAWRVLRKHVNSNHTYVRNTPIKVNSRHGSHKQHCMLRSQTNVRACLLDERKCRHIHTLHESVERGDLGDVRNGPLRARGSRGPGNSAVFAHIIIIAVIDVVVV